MRTIRLVMGLALLAVVMGCEPAAPTPDSIVGTWQLRETLFDPGDGSGEYVTVDSDFEVTFRNSGRFRANGTLCDITVRPLVQSMGMYDVTDDIIVVEDCNDGSSSSTNLYLEQDGLELVIGLPCFEPCRLKFEKISN